MRVGVMAANVVCSWALVKEDEATSRACRESKQPVQPLFSAELSWPEQRVTPSGGGGNRRPRQQVDSRATSATLDDVTFAFDRAQPT